MTDTNDLELFHFGVKGMKWGVRRDKLNDSISKKRSQAKKGIKESIIRPRSDEAKSAAASRSRIKMHGTDALSNKDLQTLVKRMNLEQQYSTLADNKKASSRRAGAKRYVADILKDVGGDLAKEALKWAATEGVKMAFQKASGAKKSKRSSTSFYYAQPVNNRMLPIKPKLIDR